MAFNVLILEYLMSIMVLMALILEHFSISFLLIIFKTLFLFSHLSDDMLHKNLVPFFYLSDVTVLCMHLLQPRELAVRTCARENIDLNRLHSFDHLVEIVLSNCKILKQLKQAKCKCLQI